MNRARNQVVSCAQPGSISATLRGTCVKPGPRASWVDQPGSFSDSAAASVTVWR